MAPRIIVALPDGNKVLFGDDGAETGLGEVGAVGRLAEVSAEKFGQALGSLAGLAAQLQATIGQMADRPDRTQVDLRIKVTTKGDLWVVSGSGQADFRVRLSWRKPHGK